ncbi:unnamed protein product [Closterium sp. Naga37s-1]|nr:unnamed protein product [Closterium sp. Naga37s-1]
MYLSHSLDHKGWRVWDLESGKVVVSRDVSFFESRFPTSPKEKHSVVVIPPTVEDTNESSSHDVPEERSVQDEEGDVVEVVGVESEKDGDPSTVVAPTLASTRARRAPHPNPKYADYSLVVEDDEEGGDAMCFMADFTPTTYREAMETIQAETYPERAHRNIFIKYLVHDGVSKRTVLPTFSTSSSEDLTIEVEALKRDAASKVFSPSADAASAAPASVLTFRNICYSVYVKQRKGEPSAAAGPQFARQDSTLANVPGLPPQQGFQEAAAAQAGAPGVDGVATAGGETSAKPGSGMFGGLRQKRVRRQILTGVNGEARSGEVTAIMGASGGGKTTLLNILAQRNSSGRR